MNRREFILGTGSLMASAAMGKPIRSLVGEMNSEFISDGASGPSAKDYVQDGIVNLIDGIENGGFGRHREGITTAYPIVDCITGAEWSSSNTFLTPNGIATNHTYGYPNTQWNIYDEEEFTVEYAALLVGGGSSPTFVRGASVDRVFYPQLQMVSGNINDGVFVRAGQYNSSVYLAAGVGEDRLACHAFFRMSPTANNFGIGVNGGRLVDKTTTNASYVFPMPNSAFSFADYSSVDASTGLRQSRLYAVRTYNRWLTDDELEYNYSLDVERFAL